jgi:signal transduction histidine kinase
LFERAGIASILLLPYGEPGAWEGVIGFSEDTAQREWDEHDVRLLQTVAQMIYAYLVRKRNAQELSATRDQALRANRFKSELLAKVSHELRTPLGAILGYSQLLQVESYGPLNEEQKHATDLVIGSTKYLNNLVNSLLDQAQLESGKLKIYASPFDIHQLIQEVAGRVRVLAEEKGLDFQVNIDPLTPDLLLGDLTRIQQVITNLLGNAIKFTETGQVALRVGLQGPDEWYIQVADTGPGIPVEEQERIFEPFRQVDGSPTRRYTGSGLGLSISNQLIQMMDGLILLESSPGKGSTFTVHLPLTLA